MIAVPSLDGATLGKKLSSYANNLAASAYFARSEAIKRNALITLCVSSDGTTCATSGGWQQGWIVRCPSNDGVSCTTGGTGSPVVFQRQPALPSGFSVITSGPISLRFQPMGVGTTQATLRFCRASPVGDEKRDVTIGATGGAAVKQTTNGSCS
jgi:type IV fimbrial biogenesis protein FimT